MIRWDVPLVLCSRLSVSWSSFRVCRVALHTAGELQLWRHGGDHGIFGHTAGRCGEDPHSGQTVPLEHRRRHSLHLHGAFSRSVKLLVYVSLHVHTRKWSPVKGYVNSVTLCYIIFPAPSPPPGAWSGRVFPRGRTQISAAYPDGCHGLDCVRTADGSHGPEILSRSIRSRMPFEGILIYSFLWLNAAPGTNRAFRDNEQHLLLWQKAGVCVWVRVRLLLIVCAFCICWRVLLKWWCHTWWYLVWTITPCCEVNVFLRLTTDYLPWVIAATYKKKKKQQQLLSANVFETNRTLSKQV